MEQGTVLLLIMLAIEIVMVVLWIWTINWILYLRRRKEIQKNYYATTLALQKLLDEYKLGYRFPDADEAQMFMDEELINSRRKRRFK